MGREKVEQQRREKSSKLPGKETYFHAEKVASLSLVNHAAAGRDAVVVDSSRDAGKGKEAGVNNLGSTFWKVTMELLQRTQGMSASVQVEILKVLIQEYRNHPFKK